MGILCLLPHFDAGAFYPYISHSNYLVLPVEVTGDDVVPTLRLDSPDHACRSFIIRQLHQRRWVDGLVAILPPCFGQDPNSTAEFFVQTKARLWRNTDYMAPLSPGGTTNKEHPAITQVTTSRLEMDEGAMVDLIHLPQFIRYDPVIPEKSEPKKAEIADAVDPDNPAEPTDPPESKNESGSLFDTGSAYGDSDSSDDESNGNLAENYKRRLDLSDRKVSIYLVLYLVIVQAKTECTRVVM